MYLECDITLEFVFHIQIRVSVLQCKGEKTYTELQCAETRHDMQLSY